jgi:hypothetical protein
MGRIESLTSGQRALPAVIVAAAVVLYWAAKTSVGAVVFFATALPQSGLRQSLGMLSALLSPLQLWQLVPLGLGIFLGLWALAPISARLRVSAVIARSLVAVASAIVVVFLAQLVLGMLGWFGNTQFFGNSSNQAVESFFSNAANALPMALQFAFGTALDVLPVVVLAVVLTWMWLGRHPARQSAETAAAEV